MANTALAVGGGEQLAGPVEAHVVRVTDGDTMVVRARIWLGQDVETTVRLLGVDTPELHGRCREEKERAQAARAYLEWIVAEGTVLLRGVRTDKYGGRVLAKVETADGQDLSQRLLKAGHARPYKGGKREPWCGERE